MTDREKAIVMAHTGVCMLAGDKFQIYHEYIEGIMGRPVWTHEIGWLENEIKEKSKADFIALCADESSSEIPNTCGDAISRKHLLEEIALLKKSPWFNENNNGSKVIRKEAVEIVEDVCIKREPSVTPQQRIGRWVKEGQGGRYKWMCSNCGTHHRALYDYCPSCGTKMEVEE
jgi:hypothetical protein